MELRSIEFQKHLPLHLQPGSKCAAHTTTRSPVKVRPFYTYDHYSLDFEILSGMNGEVAKIQSETAVSTHVSEIG